ncbi:DegT/DnrJ/EryC1/StrS family aminotransferase [Pseudonocardia cypriaca]|uniref:dTDP-4-amino-4,6-dideoxygalactose transaminase n=1 Tax=Pseudonocardia cypriaca TaxID=882449 RepID=A0A543GAM2_9PSEU|nr:DegT/DnrJ/EryC1/StrS family aminotransferase [Pseudonocardia cypriaca]TQM43126.1 dTDP-4-amino-4,6-dideoxygalactose transaminase [Pseudonocardia cypriaca]
MSGATPVPFLDLAAVHLDLRDDLDVAWKEVLAHGRFINGPEVAAFEAEFAAHCEAAHCVGVANGTDALELILAALEIGPGDEVIVPANTFVATVEAVCTVGARPRFVDVRPDTLLVDPDAVAAAITSHTAAIMAVHLYGQMADVDALGKLAAQHGVAVIEDAAQAHGARYQDRRPGGWGTAAAFSFYPGKNLGALGDGGAVVSDDAQLIDRIRQLADHGRSATDRFVHEISGRNSRLDTLQAAALRVKLARLDRMNENRAALVERYRRGLPSWCVPVAVDPAAQPVYHLAVVQVPDRPTVTSALDAAGIGWGLHYPVPCHRQPPFAEYADGPLPVVDAAAERILSLPLFPGMAPEQIDLVCEVLHDVPI